MARGSGKGERLGAPKGLLEFLGSTTALITGAGVKEGVLQIVGTAGNDEVEVGANFLPDRDHSRAFPATDVTSIVILLGAGNDQAEIDKKITVPALIDGGTGNDRLTAGDGPTTLIGGDGNDVLTGGRGDDLLLGGPGDDVLKGGGGHDVLVGGGGRDRVIGRAATRTSMVTGGIGMKRITSTTSPPTRCSPDPSV